MGIHACFVERARLIVDRHVILGDVLVEIGKHLGRLLVISLVDEIHGEVDKGSAVGPAHAHHCLVEIDAWSVETAKAELVHHAVVGALGVEVLCPWSICGERSDAVDKSLLHEVVAEVHIVFLANGECHVYRTCPVAVGNEFEHHHVTLVECALALERDNHTVGDRVGSHEHTALLDSLLVDGDIYRVGWDDVGVAVAEQYLHHFLLLLGDIVAHPILEHVLEFVGIIAKHLACLFGICLIESLNAFLEGGLNGDILVGAGTIFESAPIDGQCRRVVGRTLHLVDIPVGLQITEIADAGVGALSLHILVVPQWEGVVIAIGEDDWVALLFERHEIVASEVATGVASATVVVVPCLRSHLYRYEKTGNAYDGGNDSSVTLETAGDLFDDSCNTHTAPYSEGIERTSVGIVALTRLHRCLVEVDDDGKTCHEEQEEHHPELADAFLPLAQRLPEESDET